MYVNYLDSVKYYIFDAHIYYAMCYVLYVVYVGCSVCYLFLYVCFECLCMCIILLIFDCC